MNADYGLFCRPPLVWFSLTLLIASAGVSGCTGTQTAQLSKAEALNRVEALADSQEKRVALAVINDPGTQYRIDRYGYPAWRWRGEDDLGSCVHIDPGTGRPYLENQFSRANRSAVQKYIDFETNGDDWQCRIHIERLGLDIQRNWSNRACDQRGRELLDELSAVFEDT